MLPFDEAERRDREGSRARGSPPVWSVSRLSAEIRRLLEEGLPTLWVEGEVSNFKLHSSGHRYFTLKDESAQIACTMWRTRTPPPIDLRDGLKIRAQGRVTIWEQGGRYQFDVITVTPAGLGGLQLAFEELKRRLAAEGLFEQSRKRQLPRFPHAIGIATSPTGAAIHDLAWGFSARYPPARLFLIPVAVQGEGAAEQIAGAISLYNRLSSVDVIIIGRGGGSLEDLWAFNEEIVVRAIVASKIPVVSAVGHEVDVTLADFAADVRAPTPTAAAALVVPDRREMLELLASKSDRLTANLTRTIALWKQKLGAVRDSYGFRRAEYRVADERLRLDDAARRMLGALERQVSERMLVIKGLTGRIEALSPKAVLKRGFSVIHNENGVLVRSSRDVQIGGKLAARFGSGHAALYVEQKWDD